MCECSKTASNDLKECLRSRSSDFELDREDGEEKYLDASASCIPKWSTYPILKRSRFVVSWRLFSTVPARTNISLARFCDSHEICPTEGRELFRKSASHWAGRFSKQLSPFNNCFSELGAPFWNSVTDLEAGCPSGSWLPFIM